MKHDPIVNRFTVLAGVFVILGFFLGSGSIAGANPFTVENLLSAPYVDGLTASETTDRVAWFENREGERSVWTAAGPEYAPEKLAEYEGDRGQPVDSLRFSRDGQMVYYVHGSNVDPTGRPDETGPTIKLIELETNRKRTVAEGTQPRMSPDGNRLVYVDEETVRLLELDGPGRDRKLFTDRGKVDSLAWSPEGNMVLFRSLRDTHNLIGVYHREEERFQWLAPDVYRDTNPVWSPDGDSVAFLRMPPKKFQEVPLIRHADRPLSLWTANPHTGEGEEVWASRTGGGFAQIAVKDPLLWGAKDHLVFVSEHDGWSHLYSYSLQDDELIRLTEGSFEVSEARLTPGGRQVLLVSNRDQSERRQIDRVEVTGGPVSRVTTGEGIEWNPVQPGESESVMFLRSTHDRPGRVNLVDLDGAGDRTPVQDSLPETFPHEGFTRPNNVSFQTRDGWTVRGQLFMQPNVHDQGAVPGVIYAHGGPHRQMLAGWHPVGYYHYHYAMNQYLAHQGYAVLAVNFRSSTGYGAQFRTVDDRGARGASEYRDILAGARYLQELDGVDQERLGIWGGSYGGYLASLALARDSDRFSAGVVQAGINDWVISAKLREGGGSGIFSDEELRIARESSPVANLEDWTSPVLFIHGDRDEAVDFIQTTDAVQRLEDRGQVHVETLIFPDEVHVFRLHSSWIEAMTGTAKFLDRFLTP